MSKGKKKRKRKRRKKLVSREVQPKSSKEVYGGRGKERRKKKRL